MKCKLSDFRLYNNYVLHGLSPCQAEKKSRPQLEGRAAKDSGKTRQGLALVSQLGTVFRRPHADMREAGGQAPASAGKASLSPSKACCHSVTAPHHRGSQPAGSDSWRQCDLTPASRGLERRSDRELITGLLRKLPATSLCCNWDQGPGHGDA